MTKFQEHGETVNAAGLKPAGSVLEGSIPSVPTNLNERVAQLDSASVF